MLELRQISTNFNKFCYVDNKVAGIVRYIVSQFEILQNQLQYQFVSTRPNDKVECVDLKDVRNKHFVASSIKDLFNSIEAHKIIDFIKETRFYKQL